MFLDLLVDALDRDLSRVYLVVGHVVASDERRRIHIPRGAQQTVRVMHVVPCVLRGAERISITTLTTMLITTLIIERYRLG